MKISLVCCFLNRQGRDYVSEKYNSAYVYVLCCIAALAGLMFGYSTAVITGVVLPLQQYYQLTPTETGWAVSSIVIGCIIGALVGGKLPINWGVNLRF